MLHLLLVLLTVFIASPAQARNTDQYSAWTQELRDSLERADHRTNALIQALLERASKGKPIPACEVVRDRIYGVFRREKWESLGKWTDYALELNDVQHEKSINRGRNWLFAHRWWKLAPTINLGGIYIGTDKISHFHSRGMATLRKYERFKLEGNGKDVSKAGVENTAIQRALSSSLEIENGVLGGWYGTVSYADMEAEYQGFLFYRQLCDGPNPQLILDRTGEWRLSRPFSWAEWVTPDWDESWNENGYAEKWIRDRELMARNIEGKCPELDHPLVATRRKEYAQRQSRYVSIAHRFWEISIQEGQSPQPLRISEVCGRK